MSTRRGRVPLSATARAVLRAVVDFGGPTSPEALLPLVRGSWVHLLDAVSVLDQRGLVRLRPGFVIVTRDGRMAVGGAR